PHIRGITFGLVPGAKMNTKVVATAAKLGLEMLEFACGNCPTPPVPRVRAPAQNMANVAKVIDAF
ncbi:MAG: hypothetical protein ACRD1T_13840, partial [Acidimicrobiia bacterium]